MLGQIKKDYPILIDTLDEDHSWTFDMIISDQGEIMSVNEMTNLIEDFLKLAEKNKDKRRKK